MIVLFQPRVQIVRPDPAPKPDAVILVYALGAVLEEQSAERQQLAAIVPTDCDAKVVVAVVDPDCFATDLTARAQYSWLLLGVAGAYSDALGFQQSVAVNAVPQLGWDAEQVRPRLC